LEGSEMKLQALVKTAFALNLIVLALSANQTQAQGPAYGQRVYQPTRLVSAEDKQGQAAVHAHPAGCRCQMCQHMYYYRVGSSPAVNWLLCPDYYMLSPDHGWSTIQKQPILLSPNQYQRYLPASQGTTRRYPVVGLPTDTMQMGYYYQHVPQWVPKPHILPAPPVPSKWHRRNGTIHNESRSGWVPVGSHRRQWGSYDVWVPLNRGVYRLRKTTKPPAKLKTPPPAPSSEESQPKPPKAPAKAA
jgi:hypothetical protein